MGQPYVGEIRMFGGSFAPNGWMLCQGQSLPIAENDTLFQLIGTTYGGDGQVNFNLPDLQSRVPVHQGTSSSGTTYTLGEKDGTEQVTLTVQQIPAHTHAMAASTNFGNTAQPNDLIVSASSTFDLYVDADASSPMSNQAITPIGGSQPHENVQPYLAINFIISLFGIFPSQT
jgi:microcystin-dependent protein